MPRYSKRKGQRRKQTRKLRGGVFGLGRLFKSKTPSASAEDNESDANLNALVNEDQTAVAQLQALQAQQLRDLQQQQKARLALASQKEKAGKACVEKIKAVRKERREQVEKYDNEISRLTTLITQKKELQDRLVKEYEEAKAQQEDAQTQQEAAQTQRVTAQTAFNAVDTDAKSEYQECIKDPDNYQFPQYNENTRLRQDLPALSEPLLDEGAVSPAPAQPTTLAQQAAAAAAAFATPAEEAAADTVEQDPTEELQSIGGRKSRRRGRKSRRRGRKSRRGGLKCSQKRGKKCSYYKKYGRHM